MEKFNGNSIAGKKEPPLDNDGKSRIIDPMSVTVAVKRESEVKKFFQQLFSQDIKSVKEHVVSQVVVPGFQKILSDVVKNAIDSLLYGVRGGPSSSSGARTVSYGNYFPKSTTAEQSTNYSKPSVFTVNEIVFNDRGEATETLLRLREEIERYGMISVGDFYDLVKLPHSYTDLKYGWKDLSDADIIRVREGFSIRFPKSTPLE